jgi:integrase/recombinase XerD
MPVFVSRSSAKSTKKANLTNSNGAKRSVVTWSLYDIRGRRKYLVPRERNAFLRAALRIGGKTASFCVVLALCGARISEVLAPTPERIDEANCSLNFETLKRRRKGITRAVPVPRSLILYLNRVHDFRNSQLDSAKASQRLWSWSRTTAWRRVHMVMQLAANPDFLATPKSLRHAFGTTAVMNDVPISLVQKWLGHARLETTLIYTSLVGKEERALARRIWGPANLIVSRALRKARFAKSSSRR